MLPNEVGDKDTALTEEVADKMKALLTEYNAKKAKNFEDILDFHVKFDRIPCLKKAIGDSAIWKVGKM